MSEFESFGLITNRVVQSFKIMIINYYNRIYIYLVDVHINMDIVYNQEVSNCRPLDACI